MNQLTRRDILTGLASAGLLGISEDARSQILAPVANGGISIPRNGLIARYEQANDAGAQGALVSTLLDSSGSGYHATQSTGANKPAVNGHTVSGGRSIYFPGGNGLSSYVTLPAALSIATQSVSAVFILEPAFAASSNYLIDFGASNSLYFHYNSGKLGAGPGLGASTVYVPWGPQVIGFASGSSGFKYFLGNMMSASAGTVASAAPTGGALNCFGTNQFNATNNIYAILIYNRTITQADLNRIFAYAKARYRVRPTSGYMLFAGSGDSLTANYAAGIYSGLGWMQQWLINNPTYTAYNFGLTGSKTAGLISPDPVYSAAPTKKICWIWSGTNDLANGTAQVSTALSNIQTFVAARRATGWKCVTATTLPRNGGITANPNPQFETDRQSLNSAIRGNSGGIYGDAIADVGNDATIGQAGNTSNSTYYTNDFIHLTQAGNTLILNNYIAPAIASL